MNPNNQLTIVHKDTFETVLSAVNKMVDFIKPTLGPAGNKAIISRQTHFVVVDDGVQIARDFDLTDPAENAVVKLVRESAIRTNDRVGDGTTGSLVILQSLMNAIARLPRRNTHEIEVELKQSLVESTNYLRGVARKVSGKEDLQKVARIAFNDDFASNLVADLYDTLGPDASITIDKSQTMETTADMAEGLKLNRGYLSPYMVNNPERMESVLENPLILITDYRLTEAADLLPIFNKMAAAHKTKLVIIAENIEGMALAAIHRNLATLTFSDTGKTGIMHIVAINAPSGADKKVLLEDIGLLTGARVFSQSKGDKLELATIADLGTCEKFISRREESTIVSPLGDKATIGMSISELRMAIDNEKDERRKEEMKARLARFENKVAVIKVGAPTENEQKALKYKIEDAVNAVRAAMKGGVVPGGGQSLVNIPITSELMRYALSAPKAQIFANMGMVPNTGLLAENEAFNVVTGKSGDMMEVGVVDPVDALIAGMESAVSIAVLLLSYGILVEHPKEEIKK